MFCKHFTAPEHFSVHRDSKMFAKYGDPTNNIISSEKNLPLRGTGIASLFGARQSSIGLPQGKMN
jgi:hypothetical protein